MTTSRSPLNWLAMQPVGMFAGIAGTGVTPMQDASPLQSALLIAGIGAGIVLVVAPLWSDHARSVSNVAGLIAVAMCLSLTWTLGTAVTWLQAAFAVIGVAGTIWAVREAPTNTESASDTSDR